MQNQVCDVIEARKPVVLELYLGSGLDVTTTVSGASDFVGTVETQCRELLVDRLGNAKLVMGWWQNNCPSTELLVVEGCIHDVQLDTNVLCPIPGRPHVGSVARVPSPQQFHLVLYHFQCTVKNLTCQPTYAFSARNLVLRV